MSSGGGHALERQPDPQETRKGTTPIPKSDANDLPRARGEEPKAAHLELEQVADAWQRSIVEAVRERSIPVASLLTEATPTVLAGDTLTLEFPAGADFHRRQIAEPQNIGLLREALYEVTGRRLAVVLETGEAAGDAETDEEPASEEGFISLLKDTFDAHDVEDDRE